MYVIYVHLSMLTGQTSLPPNQPNHLKMKLAIFWSWRSFKIGDLKRLSVADPIAVQIFDSWQLPFLQFPGKNG